MQVGSLVTWASISGVERYAEAYAEQWNAGESVIILNARTGQEMPLHRHMLDDYLGNADRLDVLSAASSLSVPYLVLHGADDAAVPVDDGRALATAAPGARFEVLEGASHTMNAVHPFAGTTEQLDRAIDLSVEHFRSTLGGDRDEVD